MTLSRIRFIASAVALVLLSSLASALAAQPPQDADDPAIVKYMKTVNRNMRRLRRQVSDPAKNEASLEFVATVKKNILAAREEHPLKTPELPEAEREPFLKAYHEALDERRTRATADLVPETEK